MASTFIPHHDRAKIAESSAFSTIDPKSTTPHPVIRHTVYSWLTAAHERLLGRSTLRIARHLDVTQWQTASESRQLQSHKLARLLSHARRDCPYFRSSRYDLADRIDSIDALAQLPLLTREALHAHAASMRWQEMPGKMLRDHSRGTTGEPVVYYWDRMRQAWDKANRLRGHAWQGFRPGDPELHLWPIDPPINWLGRIHSRLRRFRDALLRELQVDCQQADAAFHWAFQSALEQFRPMRITAFPSVLTSCALSLGNAAERHAHPASRRNKDRHDRLEPNVVAFLTGEVAFRWQKDLIARALGLRVVENYGVQEAGAVAFECERGRRHICAESIIVEYVRDGRTAREGEWAEVVVTGLECRAMPVIRYCTGDIVKVQRLTCDCGRGLPVMPPVAGRAGDFVRTTNGDWVEPARVLEALGAFLQNGSYQLTQTRQDRVILDICNPFGAHCPIPAIRDTMRQLLGPGVYCEVRSVQRLDRSEFGKLRYVRTELCHGSDTVASATGRN